MLIRRSLQLTLAVIVVSMVPRLATLDAASTLSQINQELSSAKKQIEEAQRNAEEADKRIDQIETGKANVLESIQKVISELNDVNDNMNAVQSRISSKEKELQLTRKELEEAEERVQERDQLLQSRLRLMYTNGFVSYLEVLLNASSFSDFLGRFDALRSILKQDRDIFEQHKQDKKSIEEKNALVKGQLSEVKTMYVKLEEYKAALKKKEAEKEVLIASYDREIKELEEISEHQEQALISLARQVSELEAQKKKQSTRSRTYTGGNLGMPIENYSRMSSPFGSRIHPVTGVRKMHNGMDFAAPSGTDIVAAESGVVILAQSWSGYGNTVIIDHGQGLWTLYGHIRNNGIKVSNGDTVDKGQKIAEVGMTGTATGNNLHFEVRVDENPTNPDPYLTSE